LGKAVGVGASNRRHPEINAKKYMVFKKRGRRGCEDQRQGKRDGGRKRCEDQRQGKRYGKRYGMPCFINEGKFSPFTI
jgi:hypothetical protein